jgi:hypothetical protein
MHHFVVIVMVFLLLVVCTIFAGVAGGEIKMHVFGPLTGKEERFGMTRGWF